MEWVQIIGGGITGAVLTQGLTWARERRRNRDAYRSPQRDAIAEWMVAHNELKIAMADILDATKPAVTDNEANRALNAFARALLDLDRAFSVCRLVVVDPPCRDQMAIAREGYNDVREALKVVEGGPSPQAFMAFLGRVAAASNALDQRRIELVDLASVRLAAVPPWADRIRDRGKPDQESN